MKRIIISMVPAGIVASLIFTGAVSRGGRQSLVPKVRAQDGCSVASLRGAYAFYRAGATSAGPLAAVGLLTLDGNGSGNFRQTIRRNGVTTSDLFDPPSEGAYEVDPDCTGRILTPDGSVLGHFVIVDGGNEFFNISLSPGNNVYGVFSKINSHRNHQD